MDFNYIGTGGLTLSGCADFSITEKFFVTFGVGSIVYNCRKATQKGQLEKIAIKKVIINSTQETYIDTFNAIWDATELCTHEEALAAAIQYYEDQLAAAEALPC